MAKLYGWAGKILRVDLTTSKITDVDTSNYVPQFIGGSGVCAKIAWDEISPSVKAFDANNKIIFMTGPMAGTLAPSAGRADVALISPLTYPGEYYARSNFGGHWAAELKFAGYDGVIVEGKASKPVWIWINDGKAEIRDATKYWGLGLYSVQEAIRNDLGSEEPCIVAVGPAGENLVRCSGIATDNGNFASWAGSGAVMGSKKLKAIAVQGTGGVEVAKPKEFTDYALWMRRLLRRPEAKPPCQIERLSLHRTGQGGEDNIAFIREHTIKAAGCVGCPTSCRPMYKTPGGVQSAISQWCAAVWYGSEDAAKHGRQTVVSLKATGLRDELGIDARDVYLIVSWLQACYKDGTLTPAKTGITMDDLGEYEWAERLCNMIAYRKGFGDTLAEGMARACDSLGGIGRQSFYVTSCMADWWQHPYQPSMYPVSALLAATDVTVRMGLAHSWGREVMYKHQDHSGNAGWVTIDEFVNGLKAIFGRSDIINHTDDAYYEPNKAWLAKWFEDFKTATCEGMEFCDFISPNFWSWYSDKPNRISYSPDGEAKLFSLATGIEWDTKTMMKAGERIRNMERAIMVRAGRRRNNDTLDDRYFTMAFKDFPGTTNADGQLVKQTRTLDRTKFESLKDAYYTERGWDLKTGIPTRAKLEELGMKDVADKLGV